MIHAGSTCPVKKDYGSNGRALITVGQPLVRLMLDRLSKLNTASQFSKEFVQYAGERGELLCLETEILFQNRHYFSAAIRINKL